MYCPGDGLVYYCRIHVSTTACMNHFERFRAKQMLFKCVQREWTDVNRFGGGRDTGGTV